MIFEGDVDMKSPSPLHRSLSKSCICSKLLALYSCGESHCGTVSMG